MCARLQKISLIDNGENGWPSRYAIRMDWSNDRHHLFSLDDTTPEAVDIALREIAAMVWADSSLLVAHPPRTAVN